MRQSIYAIVMLLLFVGCQRTSDEELYTQAGRGAKFFASLNENDTRTYINEDIKLRWHAKDQITLFVGSTLNKQYQFDGETGDNAGYFSDISTPAFGAGNAVDRHYAVYPYDSSIKLSEEGALTVTFPKEQRYAEGSFGRGANLMVATTANTSDYNLIFRNVGSYLRLRLWGDNQTIKSIMVTSLGEEAIAGKATVTPQYNADPTCVMTGREKSVTLTCEQSVKVSSSEDAPTEFWIVLPPVTLAQGFTVEVCNESGGTQLFNVDKSFIFERNKYYSLTRELSIESNTTPPNDEIWYTTTDGAIVIPKYSVETGKTIISNTYSNGKGVIKFDAAITLIANNAFQGCETLESVSLPCELKQINTGAFSKCTNLKEITIPRSLKNIDGTPFSECSNLVRVNIQDLSAWCSIRFSAYNSNPLLQAKNLYLNGKIVVELNIPDDISSISAHAFRGCECIEIVNIPDNITSIGNQAFYQCKSIREISLSSGLKAINDSVFGWCESLDSITIPSGVTSIGSHAFHYCTNLTSIEIPNSVTSIGTWAFQRCTKLESFTFPNNIKTIERAIFLDCTSLKSVTIPNGVTTINLDAFNGCSSLVNITLPNSLKTLDSQVFQECESLTSITLPTSITSFGDEVFVECRNMQEFKGLYAADGGRCLIKDGTLLTYANKSGTSYTIPNSVTAIDSRAFEECDDLQSITFTDNIKTIGEDAFYRCDGLTSITVPKNIESLGDGAFGDCQNLKKAVFLNCPTTLGSSIFIYCDNLQTVWLPANTTFISHGFVHSCPSLTEIYCAATTPPTIDSNYLLFGSTESIKSIYVPTASVSAYKKADKWSYHSSLIKGYDFSSGDNGESGDDDEDEISDVPDRETPNNNEIFYTSSDGNKIVPNSGAFSVSITSNIYSKEKNKGVITFSKDITEIGEEAFKDKTTLTSVTLPAGIKRIGDYAFAYTGLRSFTTPESTYCIDAYAFYNCSKLTDLDLGSVIMVEDYAFKGCSLTELYIPETLEHTGITPFKCSTLMKFTGPTVQGDGKSLHLGYWLVQLADGACKNLTSYTVPSGVRTIFDEVFMGYSNLKTITISEGVDTIRSKAFYGCSGLKKVILPSSLSILYNYAFMNCGSLKSIYFNSARAPLANYSAGESWDLCSRNVVIRVAKGSLTSYTYEGAWQGYNVVEFEPGDYSHDDEPGGGGDDGGGDDGNLEDLNNGDVIVLQKASKGNGIDIVIMGDAYTQSQINSGKYRRDLETAIELLFDEEPYKSHREFFNIYEIVAVSESSSYGSGSTVFEGYFGGGTLVGGNHDTVAGYTSLAVPANRINEALIIVIMNRNYYAGTCYMFFPIIEEADYGAGASISYFPLGTDDEMLGQIIRHEAGGHGFAKLFDEYSYLENGMIPATRVAEKKALQDDWGWGKNIDFTSDENLVRWKRFLNDSRYKYEGLGVYQGGDTYPYGVWRPTYNSIMNDNTGGFNAPSREAIYYRIHKLAYGNSWAYSYETFVSWDAKNRSANAMAIKRAQTSTVAPTHPPIIVNRALVNAK